MTDVRALLRSERLARRIDHAYAAYSSSGTLSCTVCHLNLKAESLWEPHLNGKTHRQNLQRLQVTKSSEVLPPPFATQTAPTLPLAVRNSNGKKRKVDDEGDEDAVQLGKKRKAEDSEEEQQERNGSMRKKAKATAMLLIGFLDEETNEKASAIEPQPGETAASTHESPLPPVGTSSALPRDFFDRSTFASAKLHPSAQTSTTSQTGQAAVNEDEWAAFERDIARPPPSTPPRNVASSVLTATADIAVAPITAEELAAREKEAAGMQSKERREVEAEGEKEDAARALEEEFDEMDALEARLQRLKERRENLRADEDVEDINTELNEETGGIDVSAHSETEDDEEDYDEFDGWGLR